MRRLKKRLLWECFIEADNRKLMAQAEKDAAVLMDTKIPQNVFMAGWNYRFRRKRR